MEKLQPLITHRFWILTGVALLLPVIGWWSATGKLKAEYEERSTKLDSTLSGIPSGAADPNQSWVDELEVRNKLRAQRNEESINHLWKRQEALLRWPDNIKAEMAEVPFRGEPQQTSSFDKFSRVPDLYRNEYQIELEKVWRIPHPIDPVTQQGKLSLSPQTLPQVPSNQWDELPPSWAEMWEAQEDIWLLTDLLQAIDRVNEGTNSVIDSYVKSIETVQLFGGSRDSDGKVGGGTTAARSGGGMGGGADDMAMMEMDDASFGGFGGGGSSGGFRGGMDDAAGGGGSSLDIGIDLKEEFGTIVTGYSGSAPRRGGFGGGGASGMMADQAAAAPTEAPKIQRYLEAEGSLPYRTRGFHLKLVIDHRRVPDLIVELTNSRWPVEVVRVHQGALNDVQVTGGGSARGGMAGMGGMGRMGRMGLPGVGGEDAGLDEAGESFAGSSAPGIGGFGGQGRGSRDLLSAAMSDPNLVTVEVAGTMTLFNPPASAEEQPADGASSTEEQPAVAEGDAVPAPVDAATGEGEATAGETPAAATGDAATGDVPADSTTPAADAAPATSVEDANAPAAADDKAEPATEGAEPPADAATGDASGANVEEKSTAEAGAAANGSE